MKKQTLILIAILILQFIVSCSSEQTEEKKSTEYSHSTEKEFEAIEKGEAPKSKKTTTPSAPQKQSRIFHEKTSAPVILVPVKEVPKKDNPELVSNEQLSSKNQERLQEINQNLAFYCMKHRKDAAFSSEENCLNFTKRVLNDCEKKHKLINTVMVNCIKERLKKRK